jgi:hypothetical protein
MDKTPTEHDGGIVPKKQIVIFPEPRFEEDRSDMERKEEQALEDASNRVRKEVHKIALYVLRFGAGILLTILVVRVWHLIGPSWWRWLSDLDIQNIDKMLFSSAFGGIVFGYLKEIMRPIDKK